MTITKRVTFIAKPDGIKKMKELLSAMVIPSKAEDGCIFYEIVQYENRPEKFMAVETWRDEKALDGHKGKSVDLVCRLLLEKKNIELLMGILMTALGRARAQGSTVLCRNLIKQTG